MAGRREVTPVQMPETYYRVGHYILKETLGVGSFGKVKIAEDERTGVRYACKILEKEMVKESAKSIQVQKEIDSMRRLRHKNTVALVRVLTTSTKIYILMEYVAGGELLTKIQRLRRLSEPHARFYFRQLVDGVQYCHENGVYHRDLKPENLLLDEHGTLKITDFGLSTLKNHHLTGTLTGSKPLQSQCGTPNYVAPEIVTLGNGCIGYSGERVDAWSCGVILYVLVSGSLPFDSADIGKLFRLILRADPKFPSYFSDDLKDLIRKLLTVDPTRRYTLAEVRGHRWFAGPVEHMSAHQILSANSTAMHTNDVESHQAQSGSTRPTSYVRSPESTSKNSHPNVVPVLHDQLPDEGSVLQNGHAPPLPLEEASGSAYLPLLPSPSAAQRQVRGPVQSLDSLDMKIEAVHVGPEVELVSQEFDENVDLESDDNACDFAESSNAETSAYYNTDVDANDSMYADSYAVYSDGTDYLGTDNLSESATGMTTHDHSYYDQGDHDPHVNGQMYDAENHQGLHSIQGELPEETPHQNGYHNPPTTLTSTSNDLKVSRQNTSRQISSDHNYYAVNDDHTPTVPFLVKKPEIEDYQNAFETTASSVRGTSQILNSTVPKMPSHRVPSATTTECGDDLNYETSTTENTYSLPLTEERVYRHSITDDFEHTATSVDDSASSISDERKHGVHGKTNTTPPYSEYEGEEAHNMPKSNGYPVYTAKPNKTDPKRYDGRRRVQSLNSILKRSENVSPPEVEGLSETGDDTETNFMGGSHSKEVSSQIRNQANLHQRVAVQSFHFGDSPEDVVRAEKIKTLAKDVQQLFVGSEKSETRPPDNNNCVCKIVSNGKVSPPNVQDLPRGSSLRHSHTHESYFSGHKPRRKSRTQATGMNPASREPVTRNGLTTVRHQSHLEKGENRRDSVRGQPSRTTRRNAPKQLRFSVSNSKKESDWVRTEADRRDWCQLMKDFDLIPDLEEFGIDSATLSERWQASLASENLSIPRFSDHTFHANYVRPRSAQYLSSRRESAKDSGRANGVPAEPTRKSKSRRPKRDLSVTVPSGYQDSRSHHGTYSHDIPSLSLARSDVDSNGVLDEHAPGALKSDDEKPNSGVLSNEVAFEVLGKGRNRPKKDSLTRTGNRAIWSPDQNQNHLNASPLCKAGYDLGLGEAEGAGLPSTDVHITDTGGVHFENDIPNSGVSLETNSNGKANSIHPETESFTCTPERPSSSQLQSSPRPLTCDPDGSRDVDPRNAYCGTLLVREVADRKELELGHEPNQSVIEHRLTQVQPIDTCIDSSPVKNARGDSVTTSEDSKRRTPRSYRATVSTQDSNRTTSSRDNRDLSGVPEDGSSTTHTSGGDGDSHTNHSLLGSRSLSERENAASSGHTDVVLLRPRLSSQFRSNVNAIDPFNLDIPAPKGVPPPPRHVRRPLTIFLSKTAAWKDSVAKKPFGMPFSQQTPRFETILKPNQSFTLMGVVLEICGCVVTATHNSTDRHQVKCRWQGHESVVCASISISVFVEDELSVITIRRCGTTAFSSHTDFQAFVAMIRKTFNVKVKKIGEHNENPIFNVAGKLTRHGRNLLYDSDNESENIDFLDTERSGDDSNGERQGRVHFDTDAFETKEDGIISQRSSQSGNPGGGDNKRNTRFKSLNDWRRIIRSRSHPENINV